jgi:hypothetical protein
MAHVIQMNDILSCRVVAFDNNKTQMGVNVLWYVCTGTGPGATSTELDLSASLTATLKPVYLPIMHAHADFRGLGVTVVKPVRFIEQHTSPGAPIAGTGGPDAMPLQVSYLIKILTALAGRKNRGRIYPPFPPSAFANTDGTMTAGAQTALGNLQAAIPLTITLGALPAVTNLALGVYHKSTGTISIATSTAPVFRWATQRRRGDEGRTNIAPF